MKFCAASGCLQPGFRFHPTNVELVMYYLKRKVLRKVLKPEMITEVDVYQFHPKDLRELACLKRDLNWYFFCQRGKKYGCGVRTNRATHCGFWKATGNDRDVSYEDRIVGKIKTLVFHEGKPPKGKRTDWVMHEYRLEDKKLADAGVCQDSYVLCKIFEKSGLGPKNSEQYGAPFIEEEWEEELEIVDCAQVMHVGDHNQSTSVVNNSDVTSVLLSASAFPASASELAYSGAVSISAVDQAPLVPNEAAANIASSSKSPIPYFDCGMDQMLTPVSLAGNLVTSSNGPLPNYNDPAAWASSPIMPNDAAIASTSAGPIPIDDDYEMDRLLDMFVVGDGGIFESLEDLDQRTAQGLESCWRNFTDNSCLNLSDLDEPL